MITRFRKGQQIRQNDLNNIINGLTGRMVGGPGVNVRKMAGGMVIDADARMVEQPQGPPGIIRLNKNTLNERARAPYGTTLTDQSVNINIVGNKLIFASVDRPIRVLSKTSLRQTSSKIIEDHITRSSYNYLNCVADDLYIYTNYFKNFGSSDNRLVVDKYDYDFDLILSNNYSVSESSHPHTTSINNDEDYLLSTKLNQNKDIETQNTLPVISALGGIIKRFDSYCGNNEIFVKEFRRPSLSTLSAVAKYSLDGTEIATFISPLVAGYGAITADASNVFFATGSGNGAEWYIYKLDYSLSKIGEVNNTDMPSEYFTPISMVNDNDYLYFVSKGTIGTAVTGKEIVKINKSDLTIADKVNAPGGELHRTTGIAIDGDNLYVTLTAGFGGT